MVYNPFGKEFDEIKREDLTVLMSAEVAEGYYVEYKSNFVENYKIGRSIASFANTRGGWYFIGVESDKKKNIATAFPGFDLDEIRDPKSKVRNIIKTHIDPLPIFYSHLIELEGKGAVLVVYIPGEQDKPFITRDGRIYRRNSDSSEPVPETDRYAIDRLYEEGRRVKDRFENFCKDERVFSQIEERYAWVNIFLYPFPEGVVKPKESKTSEHIKEILSRSASPIKVNYVDNVKIVSELPFNAVQITYDSVILRQVAPAQWAFNSLTVELFNDGKAKFHIPVPYSMDWTSESLSRVGSAVVSSALNGLLGGGKLQDLEYIKLVDIKAVWRLIASLYNFYCDWLGDYKLVEILKTRLYLDEIWRCAPFLDHAMWGEHVSEFGIPISLYESVQIPRGQGEYLPLNIHSRLPCSLWMCIYLAVAFGLPWDFFDKVYTDVFPYKPAD